MSSVDDRLEAQLDGFLDDAPVDAVSRRALATLSKGEIELISDAVTPFESRQAVIEWMTRCSVHSLGQLPETWFTAAESDEAETAVLFDRNLMSALLGRQWGNIGDVDEEWAREERLALLAKDFLPALHAGVREIRWNAVDYTSPTEQVDPDPSNQEHPAMRPGLSNLLTRSEWLVTRFLGGFESGAEYLSWASFATTSTYGELDSEITERAYFEPGVRSSLLVDGDVDDTEAEFDRENWAAKYLLPAINRTAAREASRSHEVDQAADSDDTIPST